MPVYLQCKSTGVQGHAREGLCVSTNIINNVMLLLELSPTSKWSRKSEPQGRSVIKTADHEYELTVKCQKFTADHLVGWTNKVLDRKDDRDTGRYVEVSNKANRASVAGMDDTFDSVLSLLKEYRDEYKVKYFLFFSSKPSRREKFEKLTKKLAKSFGWSVYQDRNYFLVYHKDIPIHQVD